jgi:serine/threonine-protein phosphatase 5
VIPGKALFLHGGISSNIRCFDDLRYPSKRNEIDVLWSDPFEGHGEHPNIRGIGVLFGRDISKQVCVRLGVKRIIRSHQPRKAQEKAHVEHCERIITISSTITYGGKPFILKLPTKNLAKAFANLESYTEYLR